jgi:hypothetical protein
VIIIELEILQLAAVEVEVLIAHNHLKVAAPTEPLD